MDARWRVLYVHFFFSLADNIEHLPVQLYTVELKQKYRFSSVSSVIYLLNCKWNMCICEQKSFSCRTISHPCGSETGGTRFAAYTVCNLWNPLAYRTVSTPERTFLLYTEHSKYFIFHATMRLIEICLLAIDDFMFFPHKDKYVKSD